MAVSGLRRSGRDKLAAGVANAQTDILEVTMRLLLLTQKQAAAKLAARPQDFNALENPADAKSALFRRGGAVPFCRGSGLREVFVAKVVEVSAAHENLLGGLPRDVVEEIIGNVGEVRIEVRVVG